MKRLRQPITLLMAEDDPDDRLLVGDAFSESGLVHDLFYVEDGAELLDYLRHRGRYADARAAPRPTLILLDLNLPHKDGREALEEIKADPDLRRIPVVALTASRAEEDVLRTYDLGVSGYIIKPVTFGGLVEAMRILGTYWFEIVELPA